MKYILMYNPVSGKGKFNKKIKEIKEYFQNRDLYLDIYCSAKSGDLKEQAFLFAAKYDVIIIAGGDGSINEVVNGIMESDYRPALATLPAGTANDVSSLLGFNKSVKRSLDIITNSQSVAMDVNKLNDHYFLYATAAGILTRVSYAVSRKKVRKYGYLAYLSDGVKDIFKKYNMRMEIEYNDSQRLTGDFMLLLALSSGRVAGLFLRRFSKSKAKLDDGIMQMRLVKTVKRFKIPKLLLFFISGGMKWSEDIHIKSNHFNIKTSDDVIWNTDGERSEKGSVELTVLHKELKVYASTKAKIKFFTKNN